ncbi:MAG: orotidine-5'-phosphate decarboxylase [Desulfobacterales bacterium]
MEQGANRIVFPLDVSSSSAAIDLAGRLAGRVGLFKIGLELFIRSGPDIVSAIRERTSAEIFLDLKLHDIPETVRRAMVSVADLGVRFVTVHCGESPKMLEAAVTGADGRVAVLGVTVLTSVSAADLKASAVTISVEDLVFRRAAAAQSAGCAGIVCSPHEASSVKSAFGSGFIAVTPGIRPSWEGMEKNDQQRVMTPAEAIRAGSDYLVIGRPIRDAGEPASAAGRIAREIEGALAERKVDGAPEA